MKFLAYVKCLLIIVILLAFLNFDFTVDRVINPRTVVSLDTGSVNSNYALLRIPYYGRESTKFGKQLSRIISSKFDIDIKTVYSTFKIKNYFPNRSL